MTKKTSNRTINVYYSALIRDTKKRFSPCVIIDRAPRIIVINEFIAHGINGHKIVVRQYRRFLIKKIFRTTSTRD